MLNFWDFYKSINGIMEMIESKKYQPVKSTEMEGFQLSVDAFWKNQTV